MQNKCPWGNRRLFKRTQHCMSMLPSAAAMAGLAGHAWVCQKNPGRNWYISGESTACNELSFPSKPKISVTSSYMLLQACTRAPSVLSPGGTCGSPLSLVTRHRSRLVMLSPHYLADNKKNHSPHSAATAFLPIIAIKYLSLSLKIYLCIFTLF